jgi:proteic killer suppression protein
LIKSFRHGGIKRFFQTGSKAGIQPKHAKRLRLQLGRLEAAQRPEEMSLPGWRFHSLTGALEGTGRYGSMRTGG